MKFDVTILGSGSALPAKGRNPAAQLVNVHDSLYLVDCGEGTQLKLRANHVRLQRIAYIFISHLHGDHYLGLMGLLSTFNLLGREKPVTVIGPPGLEEIIKLQLKYSKSTLRYKLDFIVTDKGAVNKVLSLEQLEVFSFPLDHRVPTTGFLFREHSLRFKVNKEAVDRYKVPLKQMQYVVKGQDVTDIDGNEVKNHLLTQGPKKPRSYAYCSDTAYLPALVDVLKGVDMIYHEATFMESELDRAKKTKHSTAAQAATIARDAGIKELLIGHFSARYTKLEPLLDEAKAVFPNTSLALESETYIIAQEKL